MTKSKIKKGILIIAGSIALILGLIGVFLPVLPTTPFLLLTSACYIHSSDRLHNWLINHKILGTYIYNYQTHHGVYKKTKIISLVFLWLSLTSSYIFVNSLIIGIVLLIIGICVSIHILKLKTLPNP